MQKVASTETAKNLSNVIKINEDQFKDHLSKMVRSTVEETLNDMLDAEVEPFIPFCCLRTGRRCLL